MGDTQPIGELNFPETVKAYSNSFDFQPDRLKDYPAMSGFRYVTTSVKEEN